MAKRQSRRKRTAPLVVGGLLLGLLVLLAGQVQAQATDVVQTDKGAVRGTVKTTYTEWLGIPYAAPPVGELRWKAPQPAASWSGVRDATRPGNACVQGTGWDPGYERPTLTEDCLYLNVYRPHGATEENPVPVFFWIHGGGLRGGAGFDTDPRKFVTQGDVVFVTHNYRLGAMGFLSAPSLTKEDADAVGNYGMLDQQAALRWVNANIRKFGGDPERVTIAGQSAGGRSTCMQLVSPTNKGLFAGAVHQSGSCSAVPLAEDEERGTKFAEALGCTDPATAATCLRAKSAADILATQDKVSISTTVFGSKHFPLHPTEAVRTGQFNQVPVMIGQTHDERTQSMFARRDYVGRPVTKTQYVEEIREEYGAHADAVLEQYPVSAYWSPTVALSTVDGDQSSCRRLALFGHFAAHTPTYAYEFDEQDPPPFVSIWRLHTTFRFGATHVNELGYIFDYLRQALPFSSAQGELSNQMISYWTTFVKTGDPNGDFVPDWPRYSPETQEIMSLKAAGSKVKTDYAQDHKCGFWASIPE
ncbi:MAG: carboxylesterase family protein [Acidobacteria bacterium]|jgi:para-nitrobenzyl esterase|nr:carboxylesterase family protein [Acidobacteriota bacterium]